MCLTFVDRFLHPALRKEQRLMTTHSRFSCYSNSTLTFKHKLIENDMARSTKKQLTKKRNKTTCHWGQPARASGFFGSSSSEEGKRRPEIRLLFAGYTGGRRPAVQKRGKTELKQPIIACDNFLKLKSKMAPKGDHEVTAEVSEFSLTCVL